MPQPPAGSYSHTHADTFPPRAPSPPQQQPARHSFARVSTQPAQPPRPAYEGNFQHASSSVYPTTAAGAPKPSVDPPTFMSGMAYLQTHEDLPAECTIDTVYSSLFDRTGGVESDPSNGSPSFFPSPAMSADKGKGQEQPEGSGLGAELPFSQAVMTALFWPGCVASCSPRLHTRREKTADDCLPPRAQMAALPARARQDAPHRRDVLRLRPHGEQSHQQAVRPRPLPVASDSQRADPRPAPPSRARAPRKLLQCLALPPVSADFPHPALLHAICAASSRFLGNVYMEPPELAAFPDDAPRAHHRNALSDAGSNRPSWDGIGRRPASARSGIDGDFGEIHATYALVRPRHPPPSLPLAGFASVLTPALLSSQLYMEDSISDASCWQAIVQASTLVAHYYVQHAKWSANCLLSARAIRCVGLRRRLVRAQSPADVLLCPHQQHAHAARAAPQGRSGRGGKALPGPAGRHRDQRAPEPLLVDVRGLLLRCYAAPRPTGADLVLRSLSRCADSPSTRCPRPPRPGRAASTTGSSPARSLGATQAARTWYVPPLACFVPPRVVR